MDQEKITTAILRKIGLSLDAGVCQSCHDAPPRHVSGTYWALSDHATMPLAGTDATSTSCFPCHSGSAFVKWVTDSKPATDANWSAAADASYPITCSVCHDPHSAANPNQLRTVTVDTLRNGYRIQSGGLGQLCMNCHRSRYDVSTKVTTTPPYYGFASHYGPHGNPQADMLLGQNAYQYGDSSLTGLATHTGVPDACVTCHMPRKRPRYWQCKTQLELVSCTTASMLAKPAMDPKSKNLTTSKRAMIMIATEKSREFRQKSPGYWLS